MFNSPFGDDSQTKVQDLENCDIVFVADFFAEDYPGGAELTTDALIDSSPYSVMRLHSKDVSLDLLERGHGKFWIFGNFFSMDLKLVPTIISNMSYSILEYDYKYCKYRSPEKHQAALNQPCDCNDDMHGKMISAFYYGAKSLWWMSESQMSRYHEIFPFLSQVKNTVLSSVFDEVFFNRVSSLVEKASESNRDKWIVLGSDSWVKGAEDAIEHCQQNNLDYEVVWNIPYDTVLEKLSTAEGFVYLPRGADTCPRMVIEAKLLGCNLTINDNVQNACEEWFTSEDMSKTLHHLYFARERFWSGIKDHIENCSTISGYTTTLNCVRQGYPFKECISSMLGFCDQIVVVDGGSDDGTWEILGDMSKNDDRILLIQQKRDWTHKRFAVFDGLQKALARAHCSSEFCWQQDSDEIVHERDFDKIRDLTRQMPKNMDLIALPVIEFWGGKEKVRIDINPWKWRMSRNKPHITHGIPSSLRKFDSDGFLYSSPGTDGCDYIRSDSFDPVPFANFYTEDAHNARAQALSGRPGAIQVYSNWFSSVTSQLPSVYHYSWYDIERKIKTYKNYWSSHWQSLYDIEQEDTVENNMFFDKKWSEVTDEDISTLSEKLSKEMGGWIFHTKVDFSSPTPFLGLDHDHPKFILGWLKE